MNIRKLPKSKDQPAFQRDLNQLTTKLYNKKECGTDSDYINFE